MPFLTPEQAARFHGHISAAPLYARKDALLRRKRKTKPVRLRHDASATADLSLTSNTGVKLSVPALILLAAFSAVFAQAPPNEPTKEEIAEAYRSKSGEGGTFIPGLRWERWRIKEIRGWRLHFKRIGRKQSPGVMTVKYGAFAKKNGSCAEYQITHTIPFPPANPQMKPILVVDPDGVRPCR